MKDEIKEILEDIKEIYYFKPLLDYITNLQEEVKSANESITWWNNRFNAVQEENKKLKNKLEDEKKNCKRITTYLQEENDDLKNRLENAVADCNLRLQENERLKELCDKYEEEHNTAFKLWTTKMEKIPTYEEKKELQDRIDKAIELLNDWNYLDKIDCYYEPKEVIDILKGE